MAAPGSPDALAAVIEAADVDGGSHGGRLVAAARMRARRGFWLSVAASNA